MSSFEALTRERGILYGGDYNPEQWSPRRVARGRGAHARGGRQPGDRRGLLVGDARAAPRTTCGWDWLDEVLDLLHAGGIAVDLATPSASPPPWLARLDPTTSRGRRRGRADERRVAQPLLPGVAGVPRPGARGSSGRSSSGTPPTRRSRCGTWATSSGRRASATCAPTAFRTWLQQPVRRPRRAQHGVGHRVLEPALRRLAGDRAAARRAVRAQPDAAAGLPPVHLGPAARRATACRPRSSGRPRRPPSRRTRWASSRWSTSSPGPTTSTSSPTTTTPTPPTRRRPRVPPSPTT